MSVRTRSLRSGESGSLYDYAGVYLPINLVDSYGNLVLVTPEKGPVADYLTESIDLTTPTRRRGDLSSTTTQHIL